MMVSDNSGKDRFPDGVKINAGGEGRVEDIGNQVVIKRGSVVDPNEVDMLNALNDKGVNVPKVIDHGYVGDEYCIKMEKIIGRTLCDVLKDPNISKDFLLQVRKNLVEQYDKMGDLYHGDAGAIENYIISDDAKVYLIDVSQGGRQENKSKEEKREILEIIDFEASKRDWW
jgi:tRNA A-37 threonylcarbamoyl transferase component Bud32